MSISPFAILTMPSKAQFKKYTEVAHQALQTFNTVKNLNAPAIVKMALMTLVNVTVCSFLLSVSVTQPYYLGWIQQFHPLLCFALAPSRASPCHSSHH